MALSGLESLWDEFAERHNTGSTTRDCLRWLRRTCSPAEWDLLSKRVGVPVTRPGKNRINPNWWGDNRTEHDTIWTRGGAWNRQSNFTRIILLGQHLDRDHSFSNVTRHLSQADCRTLETELANLIDPDAILQPEAIHQAVQYIRYRIPAMTGLQYKRASYNTAAWFFQCEVPHERYGYVYQNDYNDNRPTRKTKHGYTVETRWFPRG